MTVFLISSCVCTILASIKRLKGRSNVTLLEITKIIEDIDCEYMFYLALL